MPKIAYIEKRFGLGSLTIIDQAKEIIDDYLEMGFALTLRQLYYQFVARDLLPNKQKEYKRLGGIINDARMAGLIDWEAIEDRTRNLRRLPHWSDPSDILQAVASQYRRDLWEGQAYRPEVWIEKDALIGVIQGVCDKWSVPYFACRGYTSQSEQWHAGRRFQRYAQNGQEPVVLHLGDHDPSGLDMTRDNRDRLSTFAGFSLDVRRLALNMDQIDEYDPPPNPAKASDSRYAGYMNQHGGESWELDALDPQVIADLIETQIVALVIPDIWESAMRQQEAERSLLVDISDRLDDVAEFLGHDPA